MDINLLRSIVTVVSLLTFLGIIGWVYNNRRKDSIEAHGLIPFDEADDVEVANSNRNATHQGS